MRAVCTLLCALFACLCVPSHCRVASTDETIVIVGAGMAGIAAASELVNNGYTNVMILEAQNRIGGRIESFQFDKYTLDAGAMWVHGTINNTLFDLIQKLHIPSVMFNYDGCIYDGKTGLQLNNSDEFEVSNDFLDLLIYLAQYSTTLDFDVSVQSAVNAVWPQFHFGNDEARWLQWDVVSMLREEYAEDLTQLSLLAYDNTSAIVGPDAILPTGYGSLLAAMLSPIKNSINLQLNTQVTSIQWSPNYQPPASVRSVTSPVSITTAQGQTISADRVIVTVPLSLLQTGTLFQPSLPTAYSNAWNLLGMGTLNKVFMKFDDAFWFVEGSGDYVNVVNADPSQPFPEFVSLKRLLGANILVSTTTGSHARAIEKLTDAEIVTAVMQVLRSAFPNAPDPVLVHITRWNSHPFALGSYSYPRVGFDCRQYALLATPIQDQVYLAGEHTSIDYPATVQGALMTGRNAARAMMGLAPVHGPGSLRSRPHLQAQTHSLTSSSIQSHIIGEFGLLLWLVICLFL